ncbi:hypothetical protein F5884DRAFT_837996 [Xylogone sp. PMI_703]|nr:hypothetical protein F5884DRAFT_837996 [Xylogone sp. PMI_703]
MAVSMIALGENCEYESIWKILFQDTKVLDECSTSGLKFIVLGIDLPDIIDEYHKKIHHPIRPKGSIPKLVIVILNEKKFQFSKNGWQRFKKSLRPHSYSEGKYEFNLTDPNINLNVHSCIYNTLHRPIFIMEPDRLFYRYYKSGLVEVISTCAAMYGDRLENEDRNRSYSDTAICSHSGGYQIELKYAGRLHQWDILPLWWQ